MQRKYWFLGIGVIVILIVTATPFYPRPKIIFDSTPNNLASSICQKIHQDDLKYTCLAKVNNNEKFCDNLDNDAKNICLALIKKDESFCLKAPKGRRQYCFQSLVSLVNSPSACDKLNSPAEVSTCYVHFVSTNFFSSNLSVINQLMCERISKDQPEHNLCLAMTTQNAAFCNPAQNDCLAFITKDLLLCPKSTSKTDEAECYHTLAMLKKDISICERIDNSDAKDDCYRDYSRLSEDLTLCENISGSNQKDQCLENIAVNISKK